MEVTDDDIENLRRISDDVFGDRDYIEVTTVKETAGDVMVEVEAVEEEGTLGCRNAFAGSSLKKYHENGYVAVAVGGANDGHSAWFERAEAVEFGEPAPEGKYDLDKGWYIVFGNEYGVLHVDDHVVAHVEYDGWTLDEFVLHSVLPSWVTTELRDLGFETGDVGE